MIARLHRPVRRIGMRTVLPSAPRNPHSVTVVIPCYKYGHYLPAAVASALDQRHVQARVIIVDDHSPDDSPAIAQALADGDARIRVILHTSNQGHVRTFNDGIDAVETELMSLVSADDLVAPGALDRAAGVIERFPHVGLVYGKVVIFGEGAPGGRSYGSGVWQIWNGMDWIRRIAETGFNPILSPEAVVRTDIVRRIGGYNADLPHAGDLEYWLRTAAVSDVAQIRGAIQAYYRVHGQNMHLTQFALRAQDIRQKMKAFEVLRSVGSVSSRAALGEMRNRAAQTLAREAIDAARTLIGQPASAEEVRDLAEFADEYALTSDDRAAAAALIAELRMAGGAR